MLRVGFLGLGAMGIPMAKNLHRAGLLQSVWNRSPEKSRALAAELRDRVRERSPARGARGGQGNEFQRATFPRRSYVGASHRDRICEVT